MNELIPAFLVMLLGTVGMFTRLQAYREYERPLILASFAAHVLSAFAQVWVTREYYGIGDMLAYHRTGVALAAAMGADPAMVLPAIVALVLQQDADLPFSVFGEGRSTGTMHGFATFILFCVDGSLPAACMFIAFLSFTGKLAIYRVFREIFPARLHVRMLVATTLVPSVVFWSSGITKEAFALTGLGWLLLGTHRVIRRNLRGLVLMAIGSLLVGLVKAYILFPFAIAAALWFYGARAVSGTGGWSIRPFHAVAGGVAAIGAVILLGWIFPRFSLTSLGEEAGKMQEGSETNTGGSTYSIGNPTERSLGGQLAFAPVAMLTALFRPTIVEVRNAPMAVNALETTAITALLLGSLWTRRWAWMWQSVTRSPLSLFCFAFTLMISVGVGLGTTNLGTLSRYRMPLMPFYAALVLVWSAPALRRQPDARGALLARPVA